jgi:hypothetical protein
LMRIAKVMPSGRRLRHTAGISRKKDDALRGYARAVAW